MWLRTNFYRFREEERIYVYWDNFLQQLRMSGVSNTRRKSSSMQPEQKTHTFSHYLWILKRLNFAIIFIKIHYLSWQWISSIHESRYHWQDWSISINLENYTNISIQAWWNIPGSERHQAWARWATIGCVWYLPYITGSLWGGHSAGKFV